MGRSIAANVALALALPMSSACSGDGGADRPAADADLGGVQIVESEAPAWQSAPAWRVDTAPSLVLMGDDAPTGTHREPATVLRRKDGVTVVLDQVVLAVSAFDSTGRRLWSAGRKGRGPGEFQRLTWGAFLPGDSLLVFDARLRRFTLLTAEGRIATSGPDAAVNGMPYGLLTSQLLLVDAFDRSGPRAEPGTWVDSTSLQSIPRDGGAGTPLGRFPSSEMHADGTGVTNVVFGRSRAVTTDHGHFYFGFNDRPEIRVFDEAGRLLRIIRWKAEEVRVTEEDRKAEAGRQVTAARALARAAGRNPDDVRERDRAGNPLPKRPRPTAETFPYFERLRVDALGNLWVQEYERPRDLGQRWVVFDPSGRWLGRIEMPRGFRVTQIGADFVAGALMDEDGIEHPALFAISRS